MTLEEFEKTRFYKGQIVSTGNVNFFVTGIDFETGAIFLDTPIGPDTAYHYTSITLLETE